LFLSRFLSDLSDEVFFMTVIPYSGSTIYGPLLN
jgi:hypothetical protein